MAKTLCVAKALLLDKNGDFLLLRRSDTHPTLAGFYDLPGGGVNGEESSREALVRELKEETNLDIPSRDVRVLYTTTQLMHDVSYPTLLYLVRVDEEKPEVRISWEHKSYEWAPLERLAEVEPQIAPTYREALNYIRENNIIADIE